VHDPRLEAGQRRHGADHLLVGAVPRVDDPVAIGEPAEDLERGPGRPARDGRRAQAPLPATQRLAVQAAVEPGRGQVVVIAEGQVDRVVGEQAERLIGFVLVDGQHDGGMPVGQDRHDGQYRFAHGRGERRHPHGPGRRRRRVQVQAGGLEGGQDRDGVTRQPLPGRGQPHPPPVRLGQRGARLPGQGRDLLRDGGGGDVHALADLPHGAEAG